MGPLPDATRIGAVDLNVSDLDRVAAFYRDTLGWRERARSADRVELGADTTFLRLHATPDAPRRGPRQAGLYHVAYLLPTRADLGRIVRHLIERRAPLQGASDHGVSEALYLADPEGNGIEIYADRPRETWARVGDRLEMGTRPMDVDDVIASGAGADWSGAPDGARVGHVHLQGTDVPAAERFYRDTVGMDVQFSMGASATFLSAGGYHHHVAVNAWGTQGGLRADPQALGLRRFELVVRIAGFETAVKRLGGEEASDPSGNVLRLARE